MANKVKFETEEFNSDESEYSAKFDSRKFSITNFIGKNEDAKNSIAYLCIKWSFISLLVVFIGISLYSFYIMYNCGEDSYLENLQKGAGIITPIITLTLGYVFGSNSKTKTKDE